MAGFNQVLRGVEGTTLLRVEYSIYFDEPQRVLNDL
jgi:hypothetical protein